MGNKRKQRENKEKQAKIIDEYQGRLREKIKPELRAKQRQHDQKVREIRAENYKKWTNAKQQARATLSEKKEEFRSKVITVKKHQRLNQLKQIAVAEDRKKVIKEDFKKQIRFNQLKQKAAHEEQKRKVKYEHIPKIDAQQKKLEDRKEEKRSKDREGGFMLFSKSTMPSKNFSRRMNYSPKKSTMTDPRARNSITYSPKKSFVSDPRFKEAIMHSPKKSSVPGPKFSDGMTYSSKHRTMPNSELSESLTYSPKKSTVPKVNFTSTKYSPTHSTVTGASIKKKVKVEEEYVE
ncbi:MAG: hypothetical protein KKE50_03320 [Nanoarchaeota archaeon]|nr:hypothetical protein [Nanoarchaeota archaeon]